jgi:hypothetical protein
MAVVNPYPRLVQDDVVEVEGDGTTWRFERAFLASRWTCIFGRGCLGILPEAAPELGHGCCSLGADLDGDDEARTIAALAATLGPDELEHHAVAAEHGVFRDDTHRATRIVDGACIFLNRPGFAGGSGCALHVAALAAGERPMDWKPSVCWQLPVKVDWEQAPTSDDADHEIATVRRWTKADWGADAPSMGWFCTEDDQRAFVGEEPVADSMRDELTELVGTAVYVELRRRL